MQVVADQAGISLATVSYALRNHPSIPPATCKRIQAVARKLGYRPNPLISTLMSHLRTTRATEYFETLAYITSHSANDVWHHKPIYRDFYAGAQARADEQGFKLEEFWLQAPGMTPDRMNQVLRARGIRGILIAPLPQPRSQLSLDWSRFSAATIGWSLAYPALHRAVCHHYHAIRQALKQLSHLGYRRIGLAVKSAFDERVDNNWQAGFAVYQQSVRKANRIPILFMGDSNQHLFAQWFMQHHPDAVIAETQVLDWLRAIGQRVPKDVGFAGLEVSAMPRGTAAIDQHIRVMAAAAVDLIVGQLHCNECGIPPIPKIVMIETTWVGGKTVRNLNQHPAPTKNISSLPDDKHARRPVASATQEHLR